MTEGAPTLYGILPGHSRAPTVLVNPAVAQACGVAVGDVFDVAHKKVNREKLSFSLPVMVPSNQPSRAHFCCLGKTFRVIEEGPGGWSMNHRLLTARFPYAIAKRIAKNKVAALLDMTPAARTYSVTVVKNNCVVTFTIDDPPTFPNLLTHTHLNLTLRIS